MTIKEPDAVAVLRGPMSKRATSAEFNEWMAREVVDYIDALRMATAEPVMTGSDHQWLYEETTPEGGIIRLSRWPEGYVLGYDGKIEWKSWEPVKPLLQVELIMHTSAVTAEIRKLMQAAYAEGFAAANEQRASQA